MEVSEQLHCLFSAEVTEEDGSYLLSVPAQEIQLGDLEQGETYRVAILPSPSTTESASDTSKPTPRQEQDRPEPPVEEGERRDVEIEDIGQQGDGITRVERGYVVIVPETDQGERVTIEITDVRQNVAFADVIDRLNYYD